MSDEASRIARLADVFGAHLSRDVLVGIGDDAAVVARAAFDGGDLVCTVDAQVDGTHFDLRWLSWGDVGWRSFMAAASDLAAMGAEPVAALSSLVLPRHVADAELEALVAGQAEAARVVGAPVIGGNLARGTETSVTTTLLGRARTPRTRGGARAGETVWLAGPVGLAAGGLAALAAGGGLAADARVAAAIAAWRRPLARLDAGRAASSVASAAIDVSDGLARDACHVAEASDVVIVFDEDALLAHGGDALAAAGAALGRPALDLALHGGEDYAVLATSSSAIAGFTAVGVVRAAAAGETGRVRLLTRRGGAEVVRAVDPRGFDHFG